MATIRIKVKHLILGIILLPAVIFAGVNGKGFVYYGLGRISEMSGNSDRAYVYYNRAANDMQVTKGSVYAAKRRIEMLLKEKNIRYLNYINITGGATAGTGAVVSPDSAEDVNRQYEKLCLQGSKDETFGEYEIGVALINFFAGYPDKAVKILEAMDYLKSEDVELLRTLHLTAMYFSMGDMEQGIRGLKAASALPEKYPMLQKVLLNYQLFMSGNYEDAANSQIDATEWSKYFRNLENPLMKPFESVDRTLKSLMEIEESYTMGSGDGNKFSGRIIEDGKPVPYALVYLKESRYKYIMGGSMGLGYGIARLAVSDRDGYFSIEGVPEGLYGLGVAIEWNRVKGKSVLMDKSYNIKFEAGNSVERDIKVLDARGLVSASRLSENEIRFDFKPPEKAAYYAIAMGELRSGEDQEKYVDYSFYTERIEEFPYTLDIKKSREEGFVASFSYGSEGIHPYYLMSPLYHTGEYAYTIYAYDKAGNIMYDSKGVYSGRVDDTVHIEANEWSEADKLLLDKKVEEAVELYKEQLKADPENLHVLKVLAKLYYYGWIYNKDSDGLEGKDYKVSKEYFEKLGKKLPGNTYIQSNLSDIYAEEGDYEKSIEILKDIEVADGYTNYDIARKYGYAGKYSESVKYYKKYLDTGGFGLERLMMLLILQNEEDILPDLAAKSEKAETYMEYDKLLESYLKTDRKDYEDFYGLIKEDRVKEAKELIAGRQDDLACLYMGIMLLQEKYPSYKEREKAYTEIYEKVKDKDIKELMKGFGKAGISSNFGDD